MTEHGVFWMKHESEQQDNTIKLYRTGEHNCSYLEGQQARTLFLDPDLVFSLPLYEQMMHLGFRRSGQHLYRPDCKACDACMPSRVRVGTFHWKRRFRRILNKNSDLTVHRLPCHYQEEHYQLYHSYISNRHYQGDMYPPSKDSYQEFLVSRPDLGFIIELRQEGHLVAVAFTDRMETGLSATYTFFDPGLNYRGLGVFSILTQIQLCETLGLPFLYLGYWVPGSAQMTYKADYRPLEVLINRHWRLLDDHLIETIGVE